MTLNNERKTLKILQILMVFKAFLLGEEQIVWLGFHVGYFGCFNALFEMAEWRVTGKLWEWERVAHAAKGHGSDSNPGQPLSAMRHLYEWLCPRLYDPLSRFPLYHVFPPTVDLHSGCIQTLLNLAGRLAYRKLALSLCEKPIVCTVLSGLALCFSSLALMF